MLGETKHHEHILNIAKVAFTEAALIEHTWRTKFEVESSGDAVLDGANGTCSNPAQGGVGDFSAPFCGRVQKGDPSWTCDRNMKGRDIPLHYELPDGDNPASALFRASGRAVQIPRAFPGHEPTIGELERVSRGPWRGATRRE